jgi:hypothetical protein
MADPFVMDECPGFIERGFRADGDWVSIDFFSHKPLVVNFHNSPSSFLFF